MKAYEARTHDGWMLALQRFPVPSGIAPRRHPVMLLHGLGANRVVWDPREDLSLARRLAAQGFDVWSVELRGHGLSDRPARGTERRYGWCLDDYLEKDLPRLIDRVLAETGGDQLHWVGHSMGGILMYAYLAGENPAQIRSGVAVGSSLDYSPSKSGFHPLTQFEFVGPVMPFFPLGALMGALAPLSGRFANPLERFNYWFSNIEPEIARRINATGFHTVSTPVMLQLVSAFRGGGLKSRDGRKAFLELLRDCDVPVLAIAGDKDRQCPPEAAGATTAAMKSGKSELRVFGKSRGHESHYGHYDLLVGRCAGREVHPAILDWLVRHD